MWEVGANDQIFKAMDYRPLIVAYHNGTRRARCPTSARWWIRWRTCATRAIPTASRRVLVIIFRQPGANIIDTVDRIRAALPQLKAAIPQSIDLSVARTRR